MILYTLAQAPEPQASVDLINGLISKGYEPHGSLCVIIHYEYGPQYQYVQAMVKKSDAGDEDAEG